MTELELYKFIKDWNVEYHHNNLNGEDEIFAFIDNAIIDDFNKLLGPGITEEEGLSCVLKDGYIVFEMIKICDYFGIDPVNAFSDPVN